MFMIQKREVNYVLIILTITLEADRLSNFFQCFVNKRLYGGTFLKKRADSEVCPF